MANEDFASVSFDNSSHQLSREGLKLLSFLSELPGRDHSFKCFSVSDLKKKVMEVLGSGQSILPSRSNGGCNGSSPNR